MTTTSPTQSSGPRSSGPRSSEPRAAGSRTFDAQRAALAGVVAIPVTPFAEDGSVAPDTYRILLRRLLDGGITTPSPPTATPASSTPSPRASGGWSPS